MVLCSPGGMGCLFLQRSLAQFRFDLRAMFRVGSESWSTAHCSYPYKRSLIVLTSALCYDHTRADPGLVGNKGGEDGIKSYWKWRRNLVPPNALRDLRQMIRTLLSSLFASPSIPLRPNQPWLCAGDGSTETPPYRRSLCCEFDLYLISRAF